MTTVGFRFTKMSAERKNVSEQNIRIENNVGIIKVEEADVADPKKSLIRFDFNFSCKYEPELGSIELEGELVEMYDKQLSSSITAGWQKDKKVHPEIMTRILNNILAKANIEAIILSREVGLPSPIAMPKVEVKLRENGATSEAKAEIKETKAEVKTENKAEVKTEHKVESKAKKK